jgi:hypothetical protein
MYMYDITYSSVCGCRECAVLLSGHLSFIVLEYVRGSCATGVGLFCAAIWCSFHAML